METLLQAENILRVLAAAALMIGGYFTVRYQRQISLTAAQNQRAEIQDDIIDLLEKRIEEGKEALAEHEQSPTEHRLTAIRLEACERERAALQKIVTEWDRWVGNVWLEQSRPLPDAGDRAGDTLDTGQSGGDDRTAAGVDGDYADPEPPGNESQPGA